MKKKIKVYIWLLVLGILLSSANSSFAMSGQDVRKAPVIKGKWVKQEKRYKFKCKDGTYPMNTWGNIKGKIYYFGNKGYRMTGWLDFQKNKYYLDKEGVMVTGWKKYKNNRYYFNKKGIMVRSAWKKHKGKFYYLKSNGKMAKGWLVLEKKKYYLGSDGARVTGMQYIGGKWYYFNKHGTYNPKKKVPTIHPDKPMVALTFDDGPGPYTDRLLNCLKKNNAKATFFLVGSSVDRYSATIKKAYKLGFEIGNHSYDHPVLSSLSALGIQDQIHTTNRLIKKITGANPTLVRPPYGAYNSNVCMNVGLPVILWSIDTRDWSTRNVANTVNHVKTHVSDGAIILMHDIYSQTVDAAEVMIPWLQSQGYQLVTVSELAKYKGTKLHNGRVYRSFP